MKLVEFVISLRSIGGYGLLVETMGLYSRVSILNPLNKFSSSFNETTYSSLFLYNSWNLEEISKYYNILINLNFHFVALNVFLIVSYNANGLLVVRISSIPTQ